MTGRPPEAAGPAGGPCTVPVPPGYRVGRWEVAHPIGSGAWGTVYAACRRSGLDPADGGGEADGGSAPREVALKFLPTVVQTPRLSVLLEDLVRRETAGHTALRHERLVRTYDVLTVRDPATPRLDGSVVLVMELARGSLADRLAVHRGAPLPDAGRALREIAEGLAWMHAAGWVHGDVKPSNVLVRTDGGCCLADFGLTGALDGTHAYVPPAASPDFAPPERRHAVATAEGLQVRPSGDVWALGVIACLALTGRMPLPGQTPWARAQAAAEYTAGQRELALPDRLPAQWRALVAACLHRDPERRPTATEFVRLLDSAARLTDRPRRRLLDGLRRRLPGNRWLQALSAVVGAAVTWLLLAPPWSIGGGGAVTPSPSVRSVVPSPTSTDGIFHAGELTLTFNPESDWITEGVWADLDAAPGDGRWGVKGFSQAPVPNRYDMAWWGDNTSGANAREDEGLRFSHGAGGVVVKDDGHRTCRHDTGYRDHIAHTDLEVGRVLCVATSEHRLSVLRILAHSADGNTITFDVRTSGLGR